MAKLTRVRGSVGQYKQDAVYYKVHEFGGGTLITDRREAVYYSGNAMWYVLKDTAAMTEVPEEPDDRFTCVGILGEYAQTDIRNFIGTNSHSEAMTYALAANDFVHIPKGFTLTINPRVLPKDKHIRVDGVIEAAPSLTGEVVLLTVRSASHFTLDGDGIISGNSDNCNASKVRLFRAEGCNNVHIYGVTFKDNYMEEQGYSDMDGTVIVLRGSGHRVDGIKLENWGMEGLWLQSVTSSTVSNISATSSYGEDNGTRCLNYSAVQVSGDGNTIHNVTSYNTGASAVGCDSTNSTVSDIKVKKVRYGNGLNLGHVGKVSTGTVVTNLTVSDILDPTSTNSAGLSIVNGSEDITVTCLYVKGSTQNGINLSAGGKNIRIVGAHLDGCERGFKQFGGDAMLSDFTFKNCKVGINKQRAEDKLMLSNIDLTGAASKITGTEEGINGTNVVFDNTHPMLGIVQISNQSGAISVENPNIRMWSKLNIEPSNKNAAQAIPFIESWTSGSITVGVVNPAAHYAGVRYFIS